MPGVLLLDEQNFSMDAMSSPSFFDSLAAFSPPASHSQSQLMRHNSFSGVKETSAGLSHSAPVYHRSQSAISSAAMLAFNYYSPPSTPKKSSETGLSGMKIVDSSDDIGSVSGDNVASGLGLDILPSPTAVMTISGANSPASDLRSLSFSGLGSSSMVGSPTLPDSVSALQKFLPSNNEDDETWGNSVVDVYACDQFRMFEFKVRRCMRGRSHDWTECPFAHPGEKARRRDPRRFHYSGTACPDFRKGSCRRGDACEFAHGVFECWLHPARYRTQPCKDGRNCRRRVCFFAHTPEQLRLLPAAAQAANAAARTASLSGTQAALSGCLSQNGSLGGSYDGSSVRSGGTYDGGYGFDGSTVSHGSPAVGCQGVHGVCGHLEGSYGASVLCCASPQMSSPTSTLVGHSASPPPLSPPLSPTGSPPMSPQHPHSWSNAQAMVQNMVAQNMSCLSPSQGLSSPTFSQASLQASLSQAHASSLSRAQSSAAMAVAAAAAANATQNSQNSNYSSVSTPPAHRRHLDRLNSMPTLSIPPVDHSHRGMLQSVSSPLSSPSSCSPPSPGVNTASAMSDLIATIQQLSLRGGEMGLRGSGVPLWIQAQSAQAAQAAAAAAANQYSSGPSPLRRCSQSVPVTPTKLRWEERNAPRWEVDENDDGEPTVQRVESGRDLRAKIYGRLGKESNRVDNGDTPDIGWVNELVKDEVW